MFKIPHKMANQWTTTWSSTDKASRIQLSNGNLTARSDGVYGCVRAANPIPAGGNLYYEITIVARGLGITVGLTPTGSDLDE